ncbi:hypothetical protein [Caballeronia sp.]|uniref:hypothetical protein n=1 Tax=Caballeronia sp. TaxID=1931223 RepID=UPI003C6432DF
MEKYDRKSWICGVALSFPAATPEGLLIWVELGKHDDFIFAPVMLRVFTSAAQYATDNGSLRECVNGTELEK